MIEKITKIVKELNIESPFYEYNLWCTLEESAGGHYFQVKYSTSDLVKLNEVEKSINSFKIKYDSYQFGCDIELKGNKNDAIKNYFLKKKYYMYRNDRSDETYFEKENITIILK